MEKTSGLGKGLSSLIPNKKARISADFSAPDQSISSEEVNNIVDEKERVINLPVNSISPNPHQPRENFDKDGLDDLVSSIREHGIIQPLIVSKSGDGWQLIAGERRLRAAKLLSLNKVPAIVRDIDEQKKLEIALIENLQRRDLNALETAKAYQKLIDQFNLTHEELAQRVGKSRSAVANTLRILTSTIDEVKKAIDQGKISEGHARVLAGLPPADQKQILNRVMVDSLNVRDTEKAGREVVINKHIRRITVDPELKAKEDMLQASLGTKVEIKKSGDAGQIIIKFFSQDELNNIIDKIS